MFTIRIGEAIRRTSILAISHMLIFFLTEKSATGQVPRQSIHLKSNGVIEIPDATLAAESFEFSIIDLGFQSQEQAANYFAAKNYDGFFIRPQYERGSACLYLNKSKYRTRSWEEWKQIINNETARSLIKL
jgi:hypothetical protein